jgi:hypothetical protein
MAVTASHLYHSMSSPFGSSSPSIHSSSSYTCFRAVHPFHGDTQAQQLSVDMNSVLLAKDSHCDPDRVASQGGWMWCTQTLPGGSTRSGWCPASYLTHDTMHNSNVSHHHHQLEDINSHATFVNYHDDNNSGGFDGEPLGGDFIRSSEVIKSETTEPRTFKKFLHANVPRLS